MPGVAAADHRARGDVERREQRGGAVAGVVVRMALRLPWSHGQQRLGAVQRLDLASFVDVRRTSWFDAQHERPFRQGQGEPDDVANLLHEQRIGRGLERLAAMWLQPEGTPETVDGAWPTALAIERSDQCMAPGGVVSSVSRMVSAIASSPILRGVPGLGSSSKPSSRCAAKRRRHLPTVLASAPTSTQMALVLQPRRGGQHDARPTRHCLAGLLRPCQ